MNAPMLNREIVLDTETTGLSASEGDRLVEIGCVELINHIPTGNHYHIYLNPERDMPEEARKVHGLDDAFLADKPLFADKADEFVEFLQDSTLVIHNAPFDMGFLNAELEWSGRPRLANKVIDTVQLARQAHPGSRVNLDALCRLYGIDNTRRTLHGALLDSEILAEVYLELIGGRQVALALSSQVRDAEKVEAGTVRREARKTPLPSRLTQEEKEAHKAFTAEMGEDSLWALYSDAE